MTVLAVVFGAPLNEPANPGLSPNPAKAPWYFLGLQELLLHFHPLFAVVVIPLFAVAALTALPFLHYEQAMGGDWFLSRRGRRVAAAAAVAGFLATLGLVLADEYLISADGWWPGTVPVVSHGVVPTGLIGFGLALFYQVLRRRYAATQNEALQGLFVLLVVSFVVLTATGIWFRGEGMTLVWPWQM